MNEFYGSERSLLTRRRGKYRKTAKEGDPRYDLNSQGQARKCFKSISSWWSPSFSLPVFQWSSLAASGLIGSAAPYFRVQSGDGMELTLDMIKGKVAAIFYENKDIVDANKRLKGELNNLYFEQTDALKDVLVRLPIIDCSDAIWPFHGSEKKKSGKTPAKRARPYTVTGVARWRLLTNEGRREQRRDHR